MSSRSTSRRGAAVRGNQLLGVAGRGGASATADLVGIMGNGTRWASPVDQHADCAEFDHTDGSEPPPGVPPASDDDSDCGTPGAR
jgi:hypothetical protein